MSNKTRREIMQWLIAFMFMAVLILVVINGIKKQEKRECEKWQHYDGIYPGFTASDWMVEQCNCYNIKLNK